MRTAFLSWKTLTLGFFIATVGHSSFAQMVNVPVTHEVYPFLKKMETRQLLMNYRDAMKPLSRLYIAQQLMELDSVAAQMNAVDRSEFEFLRAEFQYETAKLSGDSTPTEMRWHVLSTDLTKGVFNFDVNARYAYSKLGDGSDRYLHKGLKMQGYAFDDVGYYFNWIDETESGNALNPQKVNTPDPGIIIEQRSPTSLAYSDIDVQLSWHIGKIEFSLEKTRNIWGYGQRGQVILSDKAPSYPQFKLRVPLSKRIDFVYFHAELNSNIVDSALSYHTYSSGLVNYYRPVDHAKYMAAHQLEFTVIDGLNLSIGESIVYSDRGPLLLYLIPVMFFKAGEHYNTDSDNSQIFSSADINLIPNVNFYLSLFIDELNTDNFFDPNRSRKQVAFTSGIHTYDLLFDNAEFIAEYTRLNPWVYSHKYTAANYTNNGYVLGDWIGQNGDDLYFEVSYRPMRQLRVGGFSEVYRKGGLMDVSYQYFSIYSPSFLYGPLHEERSFGFYWKYEPLRDLFVDFRGRRVKIDDEASKSHKAQFEFILGAQLGVW
jgi:hypothetical protein